MNYHKCSDLKQKKGTKYIFCWKKFNANYMDKNKNKQKSLLTQEKTVKLFSKMKNNENQIIFIFKKPD